MAHKVIVAGGRWEGPLRRAFPFESVESLLQYAALPLPWPSLYP